MLNRMPRFFFLLSCIFLLFCISVNAQDTLKINLTEFLERGLEKSGQISYQEGAIDLAKNRVVQAKSQRILPRFELSTQHGVIPGVVSDSIRPNGRPLPERQFYLDPNLSNDWEDWAIFTRAEMNAVQPIFSWGAINSAIKAAEMGARAAEFQFSAAKAEAEMQLYDLYYSYLLALEISRILDDATDQLRQINNKIEEMKEEENPDLKESDIFKFEIFRSEFEVQKVEVQQSTDYVQRVWNYILRENGSDQVYRPADNFLDPVPFELKTFEYYRDMALQQRPELEGVDSGIEAMKYSRDAIKSQQYPVLFLGITGSYANTPNRPRQSNPFIINSTNYASAGVGFGFRQNLNFFSMRSDIEKAEIEYKRVENLRYALTDNIILELNESYREAMVADTRVEQTDNALVTARNWVRHEQLNYDYGFGDVDELVNSIQKELELRVQLKQNVYDLNKKIAALYKASGMPLNQLSLN